MYCFAGMIFIRVVVQQKQHQPQTYEINHAYDNGVNFARVSFYHTSPPPTSTNGVRTQVVTAAFNDDRVASLLRQKMRSCSYGTRGRTEVQQMTSTAVGLVGGTKKWAVAGSLCKDGQSVDGIILTTKGNNDGGRPGCTLGPVERSTECDNTPDNGRESRGSKRVPTEGTIPLFPTDSVAELAHRRGRKRPGERGTRHGDSTDDLALADVQLSPSLDGGGVGGGDNGDGCGSEGGEGGGSGRGGGVDATLSGRGARTPFTVNADIELGKNRDHKVTTQVKKHMYVSAGNQLDTWELGGDGDDLSKKRAIVTGETDNAAARGSAEGCCLSPALLPPVRLLPSRCGPTAAAVTVAAAAAAVVNSAEIVADIQNPGLFIGASALASSPALSTEESLAEGAAGSEEAESIVPRSSKDERLKKKHHVLADVNEASNAPRAEDVNAFVLEGNMHTAGTQAATDLTDSAQVPLGTYPRRAGVGRAAVQPAEESSQTGRGAANADEVMDYSIFRHISATTSRVVEHEAVMKMGATAPVAAGLNDNKTIMGEETAGGSVTLERAPLPDPMEEEDYACDFESPKCVRFSDESLWSVHEVRASFERHELADLFYTVDELDRMSEEAEREEREEQSEYSPLRQDGVEVDDGWVHLGGDTPAGVGVDVSDSIEDISIESPSLDGDDSDDRF